MIAVLLRGLLTRKLRTVLTAIAILLGVSMIAGTYVLTDTINNSFAQIFKTTSRGVDVVLIGKAAVSSDVSLPPPLPGRLLTIVRHTPGVLQAEGEIGSRATLFDLHGNSLGSTSGAPSLLVSVPASRFRSSHLVAGHLPHGRELTLDTFTMSRHHLRIGQVVELSGQAPAERFTIVGETKFGNIGSIGGATVIEVDLATAQRVSGKQGEYDQIAVARTSEVTDSELVSRLKARIPPNLTNVVKVQTGEQRAADQTAQVGQGLNFLTIGLLAFGGIAVFVGAFIIFNTFSITVAQRIREFALLRTLGATRGQILRTVVGEALLIGILSSLTGLLAGIGIAKALDRLFVAFGVDLPNAGMVIATRTVVVALLVGTLVTLAAGLMPAVRATRTPPVAALREGFELPRGRFARFRPAIAAALALGGLILLALGILGSISSTGERLSLIGFGAVLLFLGAALLSPQLVAPLANVIGWPIERSTRIVGRLARDNAVRNPTRTAVTAAALMIGLALVGFVTIFAAELKQTADDAVTRDFAGDFAVYSTTNTIPSGVAGAVTRVPGVAQVSALKQDNGRIAGIGSVTTNGIQPRTLTRLFRFQWKQGSEATLRTFGPRDAVVDENLARDHHLRVGERLSVTTPTGAHHSFTVRGIYKSTIFLPGWCIRYDTMSRDWKLGLDSVVLVNAAPGQGLAALKARMSHFLLSRYPSATVNSQQDFKNQESKSVNQLLALIYVLLAMSLIVSLFGIVNTLVLSIYERTREIGMLRAIGTTRGQVRWLIRWESVITSVIGAILGLLLGIVLAVLVTAGLQSQGIEYALPVGQLLIWVVVAMVFGIVAAAWPARRAARLDVLQAVAYE